MAKIYSVTEFIRLTPFQKQRLREIDPEQYQKLFQSMERNFPKEDHNAARLISDAKEESSVQTID
jgi:hypothetical protein